MELLFIIDPIESFNIKKDSTYAMMKEAQRRGHSLYIAYQHSLFVQKRFVSVSCQKLKIKNDTKIWFDLEANQNCELRKFHATVMRKDPPFDMEYVYSTYLLELGAKQGAKIFNNPRGIRDHNEKFSITEFVQFTPEFVVTRSEQVIRDFIKENNDVVLKPLDGMGGASIFRTSSTDLNLSVIIETLNKFNTQTVMVQKYIPEIGQGDKRVLIINGKIVPYALARIPQKNELRGNLAAGGKGVAQALSARDFEISNFLAPILNERGLFLVGIDIIGNFLTEINVTSPTCFQEITNQTGFNVASMFIDEIESVVQG